MMKTSSMLALTALTCSLVAFNATTIPSTYNEVEDHHNYYNSNFYSDPNLALHFWVNISAFGKHHVLSHEMLANPHRPEATVVLPFDFPLYGYPIMNLKIATGFLYAYHVHSWVAGTQYIAALMANFDTSLSNSPTIQYAYNDTAFVVQWSDAVIQNQTSDGCFKFQIILLKNGDIIFVYKDVPFPIQHIPDTKYPVKVGIIDENIVDRNVDYIRRKMIYEYNRYNLKDYNISNNTAIYLKAMPMCAQIDSCDECTSALIGFDCHWCEAVKRCSDAFDRHRQDWIVHNCEEASKEGKCSLNVTTSTSMPTAHTIIHSDSSQPSFHILEQNESNSAYYILLWSGVESSATHFEYKGLIFVIILFAFVSVIKL